MKLTGLLQGIDVKGNYEDIEITGLAFDTRQAEKGGLFFCFEGKQTDGHAYAAKAMECGCSYVVVSHDLGIENQLLVSDTRRAFGIACANLYDNPQRKLKLIGVTGTNGKTSTTYLLRDILRKAGFRVGLMGTVVNETEDSIIESKFTTPDSLAFYSLMNEMVKDNCEYVVVEVSSFGLAQHRIEGCHFIASIFTNLTQDHLDYHGTMEEYYNAKKSLFDVSDKAIISIDDDYGKRLAKEVQCPVATFSIKEDMADYTAKSIKLTIEMTSYAFVGKNVIARVKYPCPGLFSVSNSMGALALATEIGVAISTSCEGIAAAKGVPGRVEVINTDTPF
ncbi:MAG: UDP-N-acetylmuramoyl-L-alanyl-D-glutamate--2,6-diaminopimelate ligase, partial [Oscillospiraceae bacterium]